MDLTKCLRLCVIVQIKQHPFIDGQTTPSMDWTVEKTKSFLWQAERSQDATQDHVEVSGSQCDQSENVAVMAAESDACACSSVRL